MNPATLNDADPDAPSALAVIVTLPGKPAVTSPLDATVATNGSDDDHSAVAEMSSVVPSRNVAVATSCSVEPLSIFLLEGVTTIVLTFPPLHAAEASTSNGSANKETNCVAEVR